MSEEDKMIAQIAAKLLVAMLENGAPTNDAAYAYRSRNLATIIVKGDV